MSLLLSFKITQNVVENLKNSEKTKLISTKTTFQMVYSGKTISVVWKTIVRSCVSVSHFNMIKVLNFPISLKTGAPMLGIVETPLRSRLLQGQNILTSLLLATTNVELVPATFLHRSDVNAQQSQPWKRLKFLRTWISRFFKWRPAGCLSKKSQWTMKLRLSRHGHLSQV